MSKTTLIPTSICALAALLVPLFAIAEIPAAPADPKHMGVATCATSQCHGSTIPREGSNVLQNEYVTWTQSDPHSRAYEVLSSPLSQQIAARLGIGNAREAEECLDCHTDNVPAAMRGDKFQLSDGVGCEACHGGAENYLSTHYDPNAIPDDSVAGLLSLDNAHMRADVCLSCHLGTDEQFASHRMMAAGHPRLSFELDTFTELWRTFGRQPHYRVDDDYRSRKQSPSHAQLWAVGLIVESRLRMSLINSGHFDGVGMFPELALYDCHACHRSMQSVQWQRLPRHGNADPGMPFINDGTLVMSLALADVFMPDAVDDLEAGLRRLHAASSQSVSAIRAAASALDAPLARIETALLSQSVENREAELLDAVLELGASGNYLDYASAEQAFMAVQMLALELNDTTLIDELDRLADSLDNEDRFRPSQFRRLLDNLD